MTRLVRRPTTAPPPLRGRAAADQPGLTPLTVFRQGPPCTGPVRERVVYREKIVEKIVYRDHPIDIHPVLIKLYKLMPYLFNMLDRPWKWLVALLTLIVLSVIVGSLI